MPNNWIDLMKIWKKPRKSSFRLRQRKDPYMDMAFFGRHEKIGETLDKLYKSQSLPKTLLPLLGVCNLYVHTFASCFKLEVRNIIS